MVGVALELNEVPEVDDETKVVALEVLMLELLGDDDDEDELEDGGL